MTRIEREKQVVTAMIKVYCHKKHHHKDPCPECEELDQYTQKRLSSCRYGENKTFCSHCKIQCYASMYKEKIREVMRFSGPRMLLYHPIMTIRHLIETLHERSKK